MAGTWTPWRRSRWPPRPASGEIAQDLPRYLIEGLENGPFGRDYLVELDEKLHGADAGGRLGPDSVA